MVAAFISLESLRNKKILKQSIILAISVSVLSFELLCSYSHSKFLVSPPL